MNLTYKFRIKDASKRKHLKVLARQVNLVWNYCGEVQEASRRLNRKWPTGFDLVNLTAGSSRLLGLHSDTISSVCRQFARSRDAHGKRPKWRSVKSLGWIPFRANGIQVSGNTVTYLRELYRFWESRRIDNLSIKDGGSFVEDARGRWYVCFSVLVEEGKTCGVNKVGIDLGLESLAVLSNGQKIGNKRYLKKYEDKLKRAQRARRRNQVRAIHSKISNSRKHYLHTASTKIIRENCVIVVGNILPKPLIKSRHHMAKSIYDAAWTSFKYMLRYKASRHGAKYIEVSEYSSSVTCSSCGSRSGPQGRRGLRIREWVCGECGVLHDRDVNAAINILLGAERRPLVAEILGNKEGVNPGNSAPNLTVIKYG